MRHLVRILDLAINASAALAAAMIAFIAVFYVVELVARYLLRAPMNWASDIGSYGLCLVIFLMLPLITRNSGHVNLTLVQDNLGRKAASIYRWMLAIVSAVVCAIVSWFVGEVAIQQFNNGVLTSMANQIPRWWLTSVMFCGLTLACLSFLVAREATITVEGE